MQVRLYLAFYLYLICRFRNDFDNGVLNSSDNRLAKSAVWSDLALRSVMTGYGFRGSVRVQKSIRSYNLYHKR